MLSHRLSITTQDFFYILYWFGEEEGTLRTTRGRPSHIGCAMQTPRGQLSFIADYLEDPAVTEK